VTVKTNRATYLVGEPIFVIVEVKNIGTEAVGYSYCDGAIDLTVEGADKKQSPNLWGCSAGTGGGSGCGIDHPPMMVPGETVTFQYLLNDYMLGAGKYLLRAKGRAGVRWKYYPDMRSNPPPVLPPQHEEGNPVAGAAFDVRLPMVLTSGSPEELERVYAPYIGNAEGLLTGREELLRAREAIVEMAPEFLEKTIAGFASGPIKTPDLAVKGLGQIDTPESRADLIKLYHDSPDLDLRNQIVKALAGLATPELLPFFSGLLPGESTVSDDQIRQWAALGLGRIGGDAAARALDEGLSSSNAQVRLAVAAALGNTRSQAAIPLLIGMYNDDDNAVSNEVCGALKELTHYEWCDGSGTDVALQQSRWLRWWRVNGPQLVMYGSRECPKWNAQLPFVEN
jgi:hypothetical protein